MHAIRLQHIVPICLPSNFTAMYLLFSLWYFPAKGQIAGKQHYEKRVIQVGGDDVVVVLLLLLLSQLGQPPPIVCSSR